MQNVAWIFSLVLPKLHSSTGCDSTSYFYKVDKTKVLKKLMLQQ